MLNWNNVLTYVKSMLSLPGGYLEKTDQELKDWIILKSIPEFSKWYPDDEYTAVVVDNEYYKGNTKSGYFNFFDSENLDIIGIKDCYLPLGNTVMTGHPVSGPLNLSSLKFWALEVFQSKLFNTFTDYSYSWEFVPPNMVKVLPSDVSDNFVVWYEREHPHDLRKIPASLKSSFLDLCFADCAMWIGSIRKRYSEITTPYGVIPLNGDDLYASGQETRDRLIDEWRDDSIPPIIMEVY